MKPEIFDETPCFLGEGPLWHPERGQFFWFDILAKKLMTRTDQGVSNWQFDGYVSACGWVDRDTLLAASETSLFRFDIATGKSEDICALEADKPANRCNDGRADPWGGFWIGTMGIEREERAGAIYRYYKGELRLLYPNITVSNSICFSPDGLYAYYCDTNIGIIHRQALEQKDGWPASKPEALINRGVDGVRPDGSVIDVDGRIWNAEYGGGRVTCYAPDGTVEQRFDLPVKNTTCPAFGGDGLRDLYITSAGRGLEQNRPVGEPLEGNTMIIRDVGKGLPEHRVHL